MTSTSARKHGIAIGTQKLRVRIFIILMSVLRKTPNLLYNILCILFCRSRVTSIIVIAVKPNILPLRRSRVTNIIVVAVKPNMTLSRQVNGR